MTNKPETTEKQLPLEFARVIHLPEFLPCEIHGEWNWRAYYPEDEAADMLDEQDFLDCPKCLIEIVGIEM